jgi:nanoRNase/pAp phosphatase (c-di-AMP/oligoRNAs hydrolase)
MTIERLEQLLRAVEGESSILILPHNDPDPDAIASAVALRYLLAEKLGIESRIAYKGIIGRAENQALVRYLDHPLQRLESVHLRQSSAIALVDTQPGTGNNALPLGSSAAIVLDHHPWRQATAAAIFADVRPETGSTSTIVNEYLRAADIEPSRPFATALFYGIKTDTLGLVRGASPADVAAYLYLQPLVDVEALVGIERTQVSIEYFQRLDVALHSAQVYDDVVTAFVGSMRRPDLAAEMADLLLRLRGIRWAICIGVYKSELVLSIRTLSRRLGAGQLAQAIVGKQGSAGGHGTMAGGQVPLRGNNPERLAHELVQRALQQLKVPGDATGHSLLESPHDLPSTKWIPR